MAVPEQPAATAGPAVPVSGGPSTASRALGPHDVRCSYCQAPAGYPCKDRNTGVERTEGPHRVREKDATLTAWAQWHKGL